MGDRISLPDMTPAHKKGLFERIREKTSDKEPLDVYGPAEWFESPGKVDVPEGVGSSWI